jgi:hypothetical protein
MYENLDKLRAEVKRCKKKIEDDKARLKMAEDKLLRAEHSQIIADVKAVNLSPEQLAEFLKLVTAGQAGKPELMLDSDDYEEPEEDKDEETEDFTDEENE